MSVLVMGIGNLIMTDDGIGIRAVQLLEERYRFPAEVTVLDGGTLGLELLPKLEGVAKLLVVDAIETGKPPGTLVRLSGDDVPFALETKVSPHQMGLKDLLAVASLQGCLPGELVLLGIQPQRVAMGIELSPAVAEQLEPLVARIVKELEQWGLAAELL